MANHLLQIKQLLIGAAVGATLCVTLSQAAFANPSFEDDSEDLELYPDDGGDPCVAGGLQIRATVLGVTKIGIMKLELYNDEDGFLNKKGRLRSIRVAAENGPQKICVNVPNAGTYAIAGYHDIDADRKLDKRWDFTPDEPYGLSNNPEIKKRRIPKFDEARFEVGPTGSDIKIKLVDLRKKTDKNDD